MPKKKNQHFAEMKGFDCVFEPGNDVMTADPDSADKPSEGFQLRGKWKQEYFKNENPITLELGCGKGEYAVALAKKYPNRNFVGVDVKGARLWRGSKTADEEAMQNVAFLRTKIEFINAFFAPDEVSEIWLTFSDPQLKDHKGTKRLTSKLFLERYARLIQGIGHVHVKTDSTFLYNSTLKTIAAGSHKLLEKSADIYGSDLSLFPKDTKEILLVKTHYERIYLAKNVKIKYIHFTLNDQAD